MHRILVIGAGSIGERHIRCFQQTERAEVSVCEINSDLRRSIAQKYGLHEAFSSLEELPQSSCDAAVICTPAHLHISMAQWLVERGKAVLIEKPLSTTENGIDDLSEVAQAAKLPLAIAYVLRQDPALISIRKKINSGEYGRPIQISYVGGQHFPFYRPAYREIYYTRHETGGGAIQDALTHIMNAAEWLVGPITRLVADADHCLLPGVSVEDTVHVMTRHDAVLGSFSLNQHQAPNESVLTVVCEQGTIRYEGHHQRWMTCSDPGEAWTIEEEFALERDDLFVRQANSFLTQVEGGEAACCELTEARQTLKVNLAALESVKKRAWIEL